MWSPGIKSAVGAALLAMAIPAFASRKPPAELVLQKTYNAPVDRVFVAEVQAVGATLVNDVKDACMVNFQSRSYEYPNLYRIISWTAVCRDAGDGKTVVTLTYQVNSNLWGDKSAAIRDSSIFWGNMDRTLMTIDETAASLKNDIDVDQASNKPHLKAEASAENKLGEILATQGKLVDAQAAYEAAVKDDPKDAAVYYGNEAIVMDRIGKVDETLAAADKAITADPSKPIPYYLKAKALINKATIDPKTNKIVAPPGCAEAYRKYLELDPNGPLSASAKAILAKM